MTSADRHRKLVVMSTRSTNGHVNVSVTKNQEVTGKSRRKNENIYLFAIDSGMLFWKNEVRKCK